MTVLITADLHRSANPRDRYRHAFNNHLLAAIGKHRVKRLLVLGDLTDQKDYHSAWLTNRMVDDFARLAKECPVDILQGNHDYTEANTPFFGLMRHIDGIRWIKHVAAIELPELGVAKCLFIPHKRTLKEWEEVSEVELHKKWQWVFTHATFDGSLNEAGQEMEGVPVALLRGNRTISGDVHTPQKLGPVTYVGAPYRINFGDTFTPRMLLIGDGLKAIPCPGPQKVLADIYDLRDLKQIAQDNYKGDMIKVRYHIRAKDYAKWPELRRDIQQWADKAEMKLDSVTPVPILDVDQPANKKTAEPVKQRTDDDYLTDYANRHKVDKATLVTARKIMEK